jgi:hypothetical protein
MLFHVRPGWDRLFQDKSCYVWLGQFMTVLFGLVRVKSG